MRITLFLISALLLSAACKPKSGDNSKQGSTTNVQDLKSFKPSSDFFELLEIGDNHVPFSATLSMTSDDVKEKHKDLAMDDKYEAMVEFEIPAGLKGDDELVLDYYLDSTTQKVKQIAAFLSVDSEKKAEPLYEDLLAYYTAVYGEPESDDMEDWYTKTWRGKVNGEETDIELTYMNTFGMYMVMIAIGDISADDVW